MTSPFKQRLASGAPLLGTFVKTPHPHVLEVLAMTGLPELLPVGWTRG